MTEQEFLEYVQSGGQVEATDWMPDEYRARLRKFVEMHANSELMGVLPEREWILRAPTLQRKLALTAKVQDEVGHAQLIYRVVEDLGKPREECLDDRAGILQPGGLGAGAGLLAATFRRPDDADALPAQDGADCGAHLAGMQQADRAESH